MCKLVGEDKMEEMNGKMDKMHENMKNLEKQELKKDFMSKAAELKEAHPKEKLLEIVTEIRAIAIAFDKKYIGNDLERLEFYMELFEANWTFCGQVMAYGYGG
jgi:hypothetical protein